MLVGEQISRVVGKMLESSSRGYRTVAKPCWPLFYGRGPRISAARCLCDV